MMLESLGLSSDIVTTTKLKKKEIVYRSGQKPNSFYYIEEGLVGLYQVSEVGNENLLRLYGPNSFFGYRTLFLNSTYPSTARVMLPTKLKKIAVNSLPELTNKHPKLIQALVKGVCNELGEAEERIMQFNAYSSKKRVIGTINYVFNLYPNYPWTYREIAEFSGTDITTVMRICKELKENGLLDNSVKKITPTNLASLSCYQV